MGPQHGYRGDRRLIYLGPELDAAVAEHLEQTGQSWNDWIRHTCAQAIGQPELAQTVQRGRPKKTDAQPATTGSPKAPKKSAKKKSPKKR